MSVRRDWCKVPLGKIRDWNCPAYIVAIFGRKEIASESGRFFPDVQKRLFSERILKAQNTPVAAKILGDPKFLVRILGEAPGV